MTIGQAFINKCLKRSTFKAKNTEILPVKSFVFKGKSVPFLFPSLGAFWVKAECSSILLIQSPFQLNLILNNFSLLLFFTIAIIHCTDWLSSGIILSYMPYMTLPL